MPDPDLDDEQLTDDAPTDEDSGDDENPSPQSEGGSPRSSKNKNPTARASGSKQKSKPEDKSGKNPGGTPSAGNPGAQGGSPIQAGVGGKGRGVQGNNTLSAAKGLENKAQTGGSKNSEDLSKPSMQQKAMDDMSEVRDTANRWAGGPEKAAADYGKDAAKGLAKGDINEGTKSLRQDARVLFKAIIVALGLLSLLIILVLIFAMIIYSFFEDFSDGGSTGGSIKHISTLSLEMIGPETSSAGQKLQYSISIRSTVPTTNITVTNQVPANTHFNLADNPTIINKNTAPNKKTSGNTGVYDSINKTITWNFASSSSSATTVDTSVTVIFEVDKGVKDSKIANFATAESEEVTTTDATDTTNTDDANTKAINKVNSDREDVPVE